MMASYRALISRSGGLFGRINLPSKTCIQQTPPVVLRFHTLNAHTGLLKGETSRLQAPIRYKARAVTAVADDAQATFEDNFDDAKPYSKVPGPRGLPYLGTLLSLPITNWRGNSHWKIMENFKKYGPIYKEKVGPSYEIIWLKDVDAIEKMLRKEGKYPRTIAIQPWREWRDEMKLARGVLIGEGEDWKRMRVLLDKQMLRPKHVATYADNFNEVVTDFISRLRYLRTSESTVQNIDKELFCWSLETIGTVLYEQRFGGLSENKSEELTSFIAAVRNMFITTERVIYLPVEANRIIFPKTQKLHEESWKTIFTTGEKLIKKKLNEMTERLERGEEVGGFLAALVSSDNMTEAEMYANVTELMTGAVDTTSITMHWMIYTLARYPDVQNKLREEVTSVVHSGTLPTSADLQKLTYLKAVIKEILRLYPVTSVITRVLNHDMVLAGYHIPKNTTVLSSTFAMGRDPQLYSDPERFYPERWLRSSDQDKLESFAWLPFGFGPRMCIGRRVAELEMQLLTLRLVQEFCLSPGDDEPRVPISHGLILPNKPANVRFTDRL